MKRKCDYCGNELEDYNTTMCDKCIGSFHRTARKIKYNSYSQSEKQLNKEN